MTAFPTPQPIVATVDLTMGSITLLAGDRDDTVVDVRPSNSSKASDVRSAEQTRVEFSNGRLIVTQPKSLSQYTWFGSGNSVEVTIELPTGSRVDAKSSYGSIRAEGLLGQCSAKTAYGSIAVDQADEPNLKTSYGDITAGRLTGHSEITGSGQIRIAEIDGTATVKNSNGTTAIGIVTGELQVSASYGGIEIDHAFAPVVAKTAYGKVRVNEAVRGSVELQSSYGELEIGIREGTAAWLDLVSQHGVVRNALTSTESPQGAQDPDETVETVEVRGRTSWGDIIVRRAGTAR